MSAPEFGEWLPIETAPKDGTSILLHSEWSGEVCGQIDVFTAVGYWCYDEFLLVGTDVYIVSCVPTHWMPLPPPPKVTP